jgi:hypothetical protein
MHPELSPIAAQLRFDGLADGRRFPRQTRGRQRAGFLSRRRSGKHPPGASMARLVLLAPAREELDSVGDDRRVA